MIDETEAAETPTYPEHAKLRACQRQTRAAGAFIDWLSEEHGYQLGHEAEDASLWPAAMRPVLTPLRDLLAEWAGIDRAALEGEKLEMLAALRATADPEPPVLSDECVSNMSAVVGALAEAFPELEDDEAQP